MSLREEILKHPATFNVTMGDGSVRGIRYSVNITIFQRACVRNDGAVFSLNDL